MKLVEIVQAEQTSDETRDALTELCIKMKKTPVNCKDNPGFIVNRLLVPYMLEAIRMVERGDATAADIDTAMKLGAGLPMGSFIILSHRSFRTDDNNDDDRTSRALRRALSCRFANGDTDLFSQFVGLDTLSAIAKGWREDRVSTGEINAQAVEEVGILEKLVGEGKKGRKSGEGFYKY